MTTSLYLPSPENLAILGAAPAFAEPLHVGKPNIGNREALMRRIEEILDRRWFTNDGPMVKEFERRIEVFLGVKHCVAMCNATVALEIAIRALGLKGEVIVPAYTFIATAHALQWQEITPVFADMDSATHNIDPASVERLITPRTTGIIGVHVWGRPCNTAALEEIAQRRSLKVMYDAAHAFGCASRGRSVGNFGACEVFSFHGTKFLNSFEGGAVVTNDDALDSQLRLMRNFGFRGYDRVDYVGTNGKMTEVCAAMGLTSLEAMPQLITANRSNYETYRTELCSVPGVRVIDYDPADRPNYQYIVIELEEKEAGLTRDELIAVLHAENILARKYFWPGCHKMEPYRSLFPNADLLLTRTSEIAAKVLVLPTGQSVSPENVKSICEIIGVAVRKHKDVHAALVTRALL
jgi:dTDP-4-amino-4,6-dideoxygalactose transaminase